MSFTARINPLEEDPFLFVELEDVYETFLFDTGFRVRGNFRKIRKLGGIFITHAHIDHLIGWDHLMRSLLSEDKTLNVYGPPEITRKLLNKLAAYDWDRSQDQKLTILIHELTGKTRIISEAVSNRRFIPEIQKKKEPVINNIIYETKNVRIESVPADHGGSPCVAYAICEQDKLKIKKDKLHQMQLIDGPWVGRFLEAVKSCQKGDDYVDENKVIPYELLQQELTFWKKGKRAAYITDTHMTDEIFDGLVKLAKNADLLVCEGTFCEADKDLADNYHHLTARQAGIIAETAQVKKLMLNHPSKRYHGNYKILLDEARAIFPDAEIASYRGTVVDLK